MDLFINKNFNIIRKINEQISGTHEIDQEKAKLWIDSQITERRRNAAKNLIDNTKYVTFDEIFYYIFNVLMDIRSNLKTNKVYMYVGNDKTKSNYFISIIGAYYLINNFELTPIFINDINIDILNEIKNDSLIILDDMMYSGKQMSQLLENIYITAFVNDIKLNNVYIGVVGVTSNSKTRLEKITLSTSTRKILKDHLKINFRDIPYYCEFPYKLFYGFKVKGLDETLSINEFLDILYYFSPFTTGDPKVSIYFDHKIYEIFIKNRVFLGEKS